MNVFLLDPDPYKSAESLVDDHCAYVTFPSSGRVIRSCKMAIEAVQLLCAVQSLCGEPTPYKPTHIKHPWARFAGSSIDNYCFVRDHALAILLEHEQRTSKYLPSVQEALNGVWTPPDLSKIPADSKLEEGVFPVCTGDGWHPVRGLDVAVEQYRHMYAIRKIVHMPRYTGRSFPSWLQLPEFSTVANLFQGFQS